MIENKVKIVLKLRTVALNDILTFKFFRREVWQRREGLIRKTRGKNFVKKWIK